ncbi:MAG: transketolase family protein [Acidobacteria bacterium]|nr:transketolase family protein [Acidobacteriota bacterium]MCB9397344.1 transketolase family protein [Acidobacteriota bacterium]
MSLTMFASTGKPTASRASFGKALLEIADQFPQMVVVDADLSKSTKTIDFQKQHPHRHIQLGIQEGNMVTMAAGMASMGQIPFIASFGCFLIGRFEQIRMSIGYSNANVKLVGTHVGIGIGPDGYSQMALEDISCLRTLANITIIQPGDHRETVQAVRWAAEHNGPVYLRLTRQNLPQFHSDDYQFQIGKADVIKSGKDVAILATGGTIEPAMAAVALLAERGIDAELVNFHSIRPLDEDYLVSASARFGHLVTVEDHSIFGGLGGAVAEVLCEKAPAKLLRLGMQTYGESGEPEDLYQKYGFTGEAIAAKTATLLGK